jgi:hypothetical protein
LASLSMFDYVLAQAGFLGSHKHSSLDGRRDGHYPTIHVVM